MARPALSRLKIDGYVLALLATVAAASVLPARGAAAQALGLGVKVAIAALFFLHGAKLSRQAVIAGLTHWRLHLVILAATFGLFPLLGLGLATVLPLPSAWAAGLIFLACLPSTVQSSIAFTAIARGNVAAAVCAASASNLAGLLLTPLWVGALLHAQGALEGSALLKPILMQLLAPFFAGQLLRPLIGPWIDRRKTLIGRLDRGSILLVVYAAFGAAVVEGLWRNVSLSALALLAGACALLLAGVMGVVIAASRALGFSREDRLAIVFCGSKKSLAAGVPLAGILFVGATAGAVVLPLMIFHQLQLFVCSMMAQHESARLEGEPAAA